MPGFQVLLAVVDAIPEVQPHSLPEVPPAQLVDQLASLIAAANALEDGVTHFGQGDHAMADVWRETGHGSSEVIAAFGVTPGVDPAQCCLCGVSTSAQRAEPSASFWKLFSQQAIEGFAVRKVSGKVSRPFRP